MIVGQKVICIDDVFPIGIEKFYTALPKKDAIYVIRNVVLGCNYRCEPGEVCLLLVGLVNPRSKTPPYPENGFNAERFRPLDEMKAEAGRELVSSNDSPQKN